jgi:hypothetical protein
MDANQLPLILSPCAIGGESCSLFWKGENPMNIARLKSILLAATLLLGVFAGKLAANDAKVVTPESVGLSSERLERLSKAMQEDIDQKKTGGAATTSVVIDLKEDLVVLYFTQPMPSNSSFRRFQTLVYQAIVE